MKHSIRIKMGKSDRPDSPILECRTRPIAAWMWRLLFGGKHRVLVLAPGASVQAVDIVELSDSDTVVE